MARGIEIRDAHFPGRAPIDAYGNGGFRFADMSHRGSDPVPCRPASTGGTRRKTARSTRRCSRRVLEEARSIEVLLVGTGKRHQAAAAPFEGAVSLCRHVVRSDEYGRSGPHLQCHAGRIARGRGSPDRRLKTMAERESGKAGAPPDTAMESAYRHAMNALRDSDRDRYLATLLMPANVRPHVAALYESMPRSREYETSVKEPLAGEIRLQWWRDVLSSPPVRPARRQSVAEALLDTIDRFGLPRDSFQRYLDARIGDLYDDLFPTARPSRPMPARRVRRCFNCRRS
jgi:uncharacterized protein